MNYPNDPMAEGGIAVFAEKLRTGGLTISGVTRAYLDRIEALDSKLGAFQYVAKNEAMAAAEAMDLSLIHI